MDLDEATVRERCTDAVFERGRNYRTEGRIQRCERFEDVVTAVVRGSSAYDVRVDLEEPIETRCTCPYEGAGACKHVVATLLEVIADPPADESEGIETLLTTVPADDLRAFLDDVLATNPEIREQFRARFGDDSPSVEEHREAVEALFDEHTREYPVVTEAIDFSHLFELADQYRERERYLAAATVYLAVFEGIDDNEYRIDAAYDHYAQRLRGALEGYVDCVLAADPDPDTIDEYAGVLAEQASVEPSVNAEQFRGALEELDGRR
ncbi:SWIM zinc finger family protein [Saliphagus sp. LR7]|uniref:SWIM zinc finger family protein n=1 Tax=Saliphagus sp. LR7 TaxID=2282654 RepID=UPI000DF7AA67